MTSVNDDALKQIYALGRSTMPIFELHNNMKGVIVPSGYEIKTFVEPGQLPSHIKQHPIFFKLESFIQYITEFSTETTQIFASSERSAIQAIIDYHHRGQTPHHGGQTPNHVSHIAEFKLPISDDWVAWTKADGNEFAQVHFAEFIEENRLNVIDPEGAALLEMVSNLHSKTTVDFQSNIRLANGTAKLSYSENQETKGNGSFEIPSKLKLGMPVFRWEDAYQFDAFLRTRISNGKAFFAVKLDKPKKVLLQSFQDVCDKVAEQTGRVVLQGSV